MSFARHARDRNWDALEEAWMAHMLGDASPGPALDALRAAADAKEVPRCLPLVRDHAEVLASNERAADAAELLGRAMLLGGSPGELARPLYRAAEAAYGGEERWGPFQEISGLHENAQDMRGAWRSFRKLLCLESGRVVYHAKGWGLGTIERVDEGAAEVEVRFRTGRRDRFPYATAVDIFEVLETDDLRALVVTDPEELAKRLKKEPLEVLRWVLRRQGGKANHGAIKLALGMLGVEGPKFSAWWRRARKEAETSEWFEVSGPSTRAQVRMLDEATDPAKGLRRALSRATSLSEALTRVRGLTQGAELSEDVAAAAFETIEELAADEHQPLDRRLSVWLFLRDKTGRTPERLQQKLEEAYAQPAPTDPSRSPALWTLLRAVPGVREQERCLELLEELAGAEQLIEGAASHLAHVPPGMARPLIDRLEKGGRHDDLVQHYATLLARPSRSPAILVDLAAHLEPGPFPDRVPGKLQRAQCLLQLAVSLSRANSTEPELVRARTRLTQTLTRGEPELLRVLLGKASHDDLRGFATLLEAGVERELDRLFTRIAIAISPNVFRGDERPFWDSDSIWTTHEGLARREAELHELKEVKIPQNSEAIGVAASYGDLSENSEWEAAIEEQRTLTARAMELEAEIRRAQLLENAAIPESVVAPGTAVVYREEGSERRIRILGPWDSHGPGSEDVVSYRSPLAAGMLGRKAGQSARIQLPTGETEVEVVSIEVLHL